MAEPGAYKTLESRFRRLAALGEAAGMLNWDMSTLMPDGGAEARIEQLTALGLTCHEIMVDPAISDLLDQAEAAAADLDPWTAANLGEMRRRWRHETALDADLVEARTKACSRCEMLWREARPRNDFATVLPALKEVLNLTRQEAAAKADGARLRAL